MTNPTTCIPFGISESNWLSTQIRLAGLLLSDANILQENEPYTLQALDSFWEMWLNSQETDPEIVSGVVNALGASFGNILVETLRFEWILVKDNGGADVAVRALPDTANVILFPVDFVKQHYDAKEAKFFGSSFDDLAKDLERLAAEWSPH